MKDPVVKGHPLHAMLSDLPIGMTLSGVIFDLVGRVTHSSPWSFASEASVGAAFLCGCAAALVGLWDYQAVPRDHPARRTGAIHGYLNTSAILLLLLSLACQLFATTASPLSLIGTGLSLLALLILTIAGWLGGELVFHLGWRVTPAEHAQLLEEELHKSHQDSLIENAHAIVEQYKHDHNLLP